MRISGFGISDGRLAYVFGTNAVTTGGADAIPATNRGGTATIWRLDANDQWSCAVDIRKAE